MAEIDEKEINKNEKDEKTVSEKETETAAKEKEPVKKKKEKRKMSVKAKIITTICVVLGVLFLFNLGASFFIYGFMLRTDIVSREKIIDMLQQNTGISTQFFGLNKDSINWFNENAVETDMLSSDGLKLKGYYFENENNNHRYAVICHGYSGRARQMVGFIQEFLKMNFSVLAPDSRSHGKSEGNQIGMGNFERGDLLAWINEIVKKDKDAEIVIMGVSMGAATVLLTGGDEKLPANVKAVISDCAYTNADDEIRSGISSSMHLPAFPTVNYINMFTSMMDGYSLKDVSPIDAVKKSKTPTLFIHGEEDNFVPFEMLDKLYNAASCEKERLAVKNAAHGNSAGTDPELYWSTVKSFVGKYIELDK